MQKLILPFLIVVTLLTNCSEKDNTLSSDELKLSVTEHNLNNSLSWISTNKKEIKTYKIKLNGSIIKENVTKTIIDDSKGIIEFNMPYNQFELPNTYLNKERTNTISVVAIYLNGTEIESNKLNI